MNDVAEDLRPLWTAIAYEPNEPMANHIMRTHIERLSRAESQVRELEKERDALRQKLAAMSASVRDDEWNSSAMHIGVPSHPSRLISRAEVDSLIAARTEAAG